MKESKFWGNHVRKFFNDHGVNYSRHEDECTSGIPDVSYGKRGVNGWIELKAYPCWPKRKNTIVRFKNFKTSQRDFLRDRGETGGHCFLMAAFDRDVVVVDWQDLAVVGATTKIDLLAHCCYYSKLPLDLPELARLLWEE